jgi:hypothetical protein
MLAPWRYWVHLAYLDDSGSDEKSGVVLCGGVVITDHNFMYVEGMAGVAMHQLFSSTETDKFQEFHARQLFRGEKQFDGISEDSRFKAIDVLLLAVQQFRLPFIYSAVDRNALLKSPFKTADPRDMAFHVCLLGIEDWAQSQHESHPGTLRVDPKDVTLIVMDDDEPNSDLKRKFKTTFRELRAQHGPEFPSRRLRHVHDAMYFGDSRDSVGLQMADLCGYFMRRRLCGPDAEGDRFFRQVKKAAICARPEPIRTQLGGVLLSGDHL